MVTRKEASATKRARPMTSTWTSLFRGIPSLIRVAVPAELGTFQWNASSWQAKAWFGNKALHYEIWVRHHVKIVELGLHFEADALTNARLLGAFRSRANDVKRGLGADPRLEAWDKGWTRIWEPFALETLGPSFVDRIQTRFVAYVRVLEPIVRDELPNDVAWKIAPPRRAAKVTSSRTSR